MLSKSISFDKTLQFLIIISPLSIMMGKGVADVLATSIGLLYLLRCAYKKDCHFLFEAWIKLALILWVYSIIRGLFTENILYSLTKAIPWIRFIFFAAAIQAFAVKDSDLVKKLLITTSFAAIFLAFDSIYQFFTGYDIIGKPYSSEDNGRYIRLTGPFNKLVVGYIITTLSLPFISYLIFKFHWQKDYYLKSLLYSLTITIIYLAVFLSGERSALIQLTFGIFLILFAAKIKAGSIIKIFSVLFVAILAAYIALPKEFGRQIVSIYETAKGFNDSPYGILWDTGIRLGVHNLFLGVGPGNFEFECLKFAKFCRAHPHNIFIEWFAEYGILGLTLFVYFIITILLEVKNFYLGIERKYYKYILIGLIAAFVAKLLPLPSSGFFKNWYAVPFWFITGWMMSFKNPNYTGKKFEH